MDIIILQLKQTEGFRTSCYLFTFFSVTIPTYVKLQLTLMDIC